MAVYIAKRARVDLHNIPDLVYLAKRGPGHLTNYRESAGQIVGRSVVAGNLSNDARDISRGKQIIDYKREELT